MQTEPQGRDLGSVDDAELARAIAQPDLRARAEAELGRRYELRVRLYAERHLRDRAAARELVRDVLASVTQKLTAGELQHLERLPSFVLATCRELARGRTRNERTRKKLLMQYPDPRRDEPDSSVGSAQELDRLRVGLSKLSDRERTVLQLSYYAERDAAAISAELGMSPGNVRVVRQRALERLTTCLLALAAGAAR